MKDTETVTLDDVLSWAAWGYIRKPDGTPYFKKDAKAAIIKLFEQTVKSAKPEVPEEYKRDDALSIGFTRGTEYYYDAISNLLKALEEV